MDDSLSDIFELESLYELGLKNINENLLSPNHKTIINCLKHLEDRDFSIFYLKAKKLFESSRSENEKLFFLSWQIIGSEVQYHMKLRKYFLSQLESLPTQGLNLYYEYLKLYFQSVSYFFDSKLLLSEALINKALCLAENINYHRGVARCLYQKSLIYKEGAKLLDFQKTLNQCLEICTIHNFIKTKNKSLDLYSIEVSELKRLNCDFENRIMNIKKSLGRNDLVYARVLIAECESLRRKQGYQRQKYSLSQYRVQFLFLNQQDSYARRLLKSIKDLVIKYDIYIFMQAHNILLTTEELGNFQSIALALDKLTSHSHLSNKCLFLNKISLSQIKNKHVVKLLNLLHNNQSLDKETLFESIYNITYDPIIHDSKIYKLILKAKKEIKSDIIINNYGEYSFNFERYKVIS